MVLHKSLQIRRSKFILGGIALLLGATVLLLRHQSPADRVQMPAWSSRILHSKLKTTRPSSESSQTPLKAANRHIPCEGLEGAADVVYIIKTGATEALEKLPVHFNTTLRCLPNYLIFSDFGEKLDGHHIHDALSDISEDIRLHNDDFDLWRRLSAGGRQILDASEMSENDHANPNDGGGNPNNGGWRLDKLKNLPMVVKSLKARPDAKWYIFTDADTYVIFSNLLHWLSMLDHEKRLYLGSGAMIGDDLFAHGGSGYVLSNAAMRALADLYQEKQDEWDQKAAEHWAGDAVLANALKSIDIELQWAFPMLQGGDPDTMDWSEVGYDKKIWCYPVISYHHSKPSTIGSLWYLEQDWLAANHSEPLRHGDFFKQWVLPQLSADELIDWDNLSEDEVEIAAQEPLDCRAACENNSTCMQFSYRDGSCRILHIPKLGIEKKDGSQSGWILGRVHQFLRSMDECSEGDWIVE